MIQFLLLFYVICMAIVLRIVIEVECREGATRGSVLYAAICILLAPIFVVSTAICYYLTQMRK